MMQRLTPEVRGLGMTSQRARDRLIDRLATRLPNDARKPIADRRVLDVMRVLPRHLFIEEALASRAYEDDALPIGRAQTISQPWVVARMTEALIEYAVPKKVLEIGTGSGYQAAVLAALVENVYTVERIDELLRNARRRFRKLGIDNIRSKHADGKLGWAEHAPYDAIVLTAADDALRPELFDQLAPDGVLVAPVGKPGVQKLLRYRLVEKETGAMWVGESLGDVSFVPLLGGLV
ncbi:MAG: protein-L-isoaspartate(D-aspartate) O-methyltransferase [Proteobacteria bacterium]|uniref:protein-L-isoaspartate(D-aspartate) O-methyltransferase n=1 Tax=Rudaea sp. TaxID=2136325 RepID=UPI001E1348B8|nr:protein-L-isoaspartate(D-aspartate) O-methyltransferase [Pseudomonadota bacterium]MBS0567820.1 protein-L-isoaspartate(D-aspartate) O-methyltransferase [Pseudomonadota bacterium]